LLPEGAVCTSFWASGGVKMSRKKKLTRLIKNNIPGEGTNDLIADGRKNLIGFIKLLIEMDREAKFALTEGKLTDGK
jgi:hypothetical protein